MLNYINVGYSLIPFLRFEIVTVIPIRPRKLKMEIKLRSFYEKCLLGYKSISLFFQYTTEFHTSLRGFTSFRDVALKFFGLSHGKCV